MDFSKKKTPIEQPKDKVEPEKQWLIGDLEQTVETLHTNAERIQVLEKNWHESEWYLGEAKARNQRLEDELREKDHYIRKLEAEAHQLKEQLAELTLPIEVKDKQLHLEPITFKKPVK